MGHLRPSSCLTGKQARQQQASYGGDPLSLQLPEIQPVHQRPRQGVLHIRTLGIGRGPQAPQAPAQEILRALVLPSSSLTYQLRNSQGPATRGLQESVTCNREPGSAQEHSLIHQWAGTSLETTLAMTPPTNRSIPSLGHLKNSGSHPGTLFYMPVDHGPNFRKPQKPQPAVSGTSPT